MNAGWWGAAQDQADRPGGGLDGALARLRARADGGDPGISVLDAERIDAEVTRLRALTPPADLPATLATVEDVAAVCEAARLTQRGAHLWADESVDVRPSIASPGACVWISRREGWTGRADPGTPSSVLWHAIAAARSAS